MKFTDFLLHPSIQAGIDELGFVDCTPIQETAIPHILEGRDVAGLAQTGTGKTAAFLLPIMDRIVRSREIAAEPPAPSDAPAGVDGVEGQAEVAAAAKPSPPTEVNLGEFTAAPPATISEPGQRPIFKNWRRSNFILILVPTRELCEQVCENAVKFGKNANLRAAAIYGGTGYEHQKAALRNAVEFIVATPGRLIDLYKENLVDLGQVRAVIFDEADRMFDMGFKDDMKYILRRIPKDRQFLVFSATLNFDVTNTAYEFGANPVEVNVSRDQAKAENVEDTIYHVGHDEKPHFLLSLLRKKKPKQAIIFSNFKHNIERVSKFLSANGVPTLGISSLISQSQRTRIMEMFKDGSNDSNVLVATDLAARGLDIKGVDLVVNYELPDDSENYVHRIGRTGRAGAKGQAYSLVSDRDVEALQRIEAYLGHKVEISWLDEADMAKDFKPLEREYGRRDFRPRPGGGGGGNGPRPHGGGGGNYRNDRGPRDQQRSGGGQHQGGGPRPHHKAPAHNRDHQRSDQPRHDQQARGDQPQRNDQRPYNNRPRNDRPPQQRHGGGQRPDGQRPDGQRADVPRGDGQPRFSHNGPRPQHRNQGPRDNRGPNQQRSFTHRPGGKPNTGNKSAPANKSASAAKAGVVGKVKGIFKKIFG